MTNKLFDEQQFRKYIPSEMLKEKRWVRYFLSPKPDGKSFAKIPIGADHSKPDTWNDFNTCAAFIKPGQGLGYCFFGGEIQALDLDHVRNPKTGQLCNEAMLLLSRLGSWAEYSVSGQGIHVFFKGTVRGRELHTQCLQFWNSKNSPRFFALTCDMVGEAFTTLKDIGDGFNFVFSQAAHFSAKIKEELRTIDPEQWAALPAEREVVETDTREKPKTKSRKLHKDFNLEDFLNFYKMPVANIANNDLGRCYRLTTCPIKGEPHVGQNATTTNFILSKDGGLGFHCQSTGCVDWSVAEVIKHLEIDNGPYPKPIYEVKTKPAPLRSSRLQCVKDIVEVPETWLWSGYLPTNQLIHFAGKSSEGKSPVTLDLCRPVTTGGVWPDGTPNTAGPKSVIILAGEDNWETVIKPRLRLAGADMSKIFRFISTLDKGDGQLVDVSTNLEHDIADLRSQIEVLGDCGLVVIDPITNYLGSKKMNQEEQMRELLMPLSEQVAQAMGVCVITVGHLNKRGNDAAVLERLMGASAFGGVARQVFIFGSDPDETGKKYHHIMGEERNKSVPTLKYRTEKVSVDWAGFANEKVLQVVWGGVSTATNEESVNPDKEQTKADIELVWPALKKILPLGTRLEGTQCKDLVAGGAFKDRPDNFWHRARKKASIVSEQDGRKWVWFSEAAPTLVQQFDGSVKEHYVSEK